MDQTSRLQLDRIAADALDPVSALRTSINDHANKLDIAAIALHGPFASMPSAGIVDRLYYADDTSVWYRDNGTAWTPVVANNVSWAVVNVRSFGAFGDGTHNDTAAIQAAINSVATQTGVGSAAAVGAKIYFPPTAGGYLCTSGLTLDSTRNIMLCGDSTIGGGRSRIIYTGTATAVSARSSIGFRLDGLSIEANSTGANALDLSRAPTTSLGDTSQWTISNSLLSGQNGGGGAIIVKVTKATNGVFDRVAFTGGMYAVDSVVASGVYADNIAFYSCLFQNQSNFAIHNPIGNWTFRNPQFEPLFGGGAGAISYDYGSSGVTFTGLRIDGGRFEHAGSTGVWISLGTGSALSIAGSLFTGGSKFIEFNGTTGVFDGVDLTGNSFGAGSTMGAAIAAIDCRGGGVGGVINFRERANSFANNGANIVGSSVNANLGGLTLPQYPVGTPAATNWPQANRALYTRFVPVETITASGVAFEVTLGDAANPSLYVAVIDGATRLVLASSAAVTGKANGTGVQFVAFTAPTVLRAGIVYYVGMSVSSTTPGFTFAGSFAVAGDAELISSSTPHLTQGFVNGSAVIASPVPALTSTASVPRLALRA